MPRTLQEEYDMYQDIERKERQEDWDLRESELGRERERLACEEDVDNE